jgi:flavorubredoxin
VQPPNYVAEGIEEAGNFEVVLANTNDGRVDPTMLAECAGVAFGTPDYFSYPAGGIKVFMDDWLIAKRGGADAIEGLPVALFLTHGGGGRARDPFENLFERVGPRVADTVMIKGAPDEEGARTCRELGRALAAKAREFTES